MAVFLLLFQLFLTYFVFRDRDFPDITLTVDNRQVDKIHVHYRRAVQLLPSLIRQAPFSPSVFAYRRLSVLIFFRSLDGLSWERVTAQGRSEGGGGPGVPVSPPL